MNVNSNKNLVPNPAGKGKSPGWLDLSGKNLEPPTGMEVETGFGAPRRIGLTIAFVVFGVFGLWSVLAPIEGSAHAAGIVTVRSYKKVIQHLEGGIVKDILVQNGDMVKTGDILLLLDPTQSLAQLEIYNGQMLSLLALEARLIAERDELDAVAYPPSLLADSPQARMEVQAQNQIFRTRKSTHEGATAVLNQRISQLESQITGLEAQRDTKRELAASYEEELVDVRSLLAEGFATELRLRELERSHAQYAGEAAELSANIAAAQIQIGATQLEILQQQNTFQSEVADQLAETQNQLKDTRERVTALSDVVTRTEVRAPSAGIVNGMQVHTIGGVIGPGQIIAEIVPQGDELVIEAKVSPADIDRVEAGQEVTVRLSSLSTRSVPTLYGHVLGLSADTLTDQATGVPYFLARVTLTPESLADLGEVVLVPGMPAEVLINTGARTFLEYALKPLSNVMARSFIED